MDYTKLVKKRLESMNIAGQRLVESTDMLCQLKTNVVGELLSSAEDFFEWDHYPKGDVYDKESASQY